MQNSPKIKDKSSGNRQKLVEEYYESAGQIMRLVRGGGVEILRKSGLSLPQFQTLYGISDRGQMTIKEISQGLNITSSAATQLVEGLSRKHFIERKTDPEDRRVVHVVLSKDGAVKFQSLRKTHLQMIANLFGSLEDQELKFLIDITKKIISHINSSTK